MAKSSSTARSSPWGRSSTSFPGQLQEIRDYVRSNEGEEGDRLRNGMQRLGVLFQTYGISENPSSQVSARQSAEARIYISELQRRLSQIERQNTERRQEENRNTLWGTKYLPIANEQNSENAHPLVRAIYLSEMRLHPDIYGNIEEPEILDPQTAALAVNVKGLFDKFQTELGHTEPGKTRGAIRKYGRQIRTTMAAGGAARLMARDRLLNLWDYLWEDAWFK